jgi:hypothetical protein
MQPKPSKLRASIIAGFAIAAVSSLPFISIINCCCCAGVLLGGVLGVYLYNKELSNQFTLEASDSVVVGIISGIFAAFLSTIFSMIVLTLIGPTEQQFLREIMDRIINELERSGDISADAIDELRSQVDSSLRGEIGFVGFLIALFANLIIYPVFSALGALIGYAFLRRKQHYQETQPPKGM